MIKTNPMQASQYKTEQVAKIVGCSLNYVNYLTTKNKDRDVLFHPHIKAGRGGTNYMTWPQLVIVAIANELSNIDLSRRLMNKVNERIMETLKSPNDHFVGRILSDFITNKNRTQDNLMLLIGSEGDVPLVSFKRDTDKLGTLPFEPCIVLSLGPLMDRLWAKI